MENGVGDLFKGYFVLVEEEGRVKVETIRSMKKGNFYLLRGPREELMRMFPDAQSGEGCYMSLCPDDDRCARIFDMVLGFVPGAEKWKEKLIGVFRCQCGKCASM
ncbi:MAG: hypothetical protein D6713_08095 [Deltaproteobacteria bacterium]|nr:MAG: hypothetical protein D6713_08095 [Deltaproteobacteria bacterium]